MKPTVRAAAGAITGVLVAWPAPAVAQLAAALDANGALNPHQTGLGVGVDGRFGYRFGLPRQFLVHGLIFQAELIAGYTQIPLSSVSNGDAQVGKAGAGARIGFLLASFEPFAYAHLGAAFGTEGVGSIYDFGIALDWRLPAASLGLHGSYDILTVAGVARPWFEFGPHIEVRWFGW